MHRTLGKIGVDFAEADVGSNEVEALARRLRAISDLVDVSTHPTVTPTSNLMAWTSSSTQR